MSDEKNDELEVQEPQQKTKKSIGMSIPLAIGAAVGILVIIILGVVLGVIITSKYFAQAPTETAAPETEQKVAEKKESRAHKLEEDFAGDDGYLSKLADVLLMETGRITTNPKGGVSVFVVVNFGLEFKKMDDSNKDLRNLADKDGIVNLEHPIMKKMQARIRGILNNMIASYTQSELLDMRPTLSDKVRNELRGIFREYELLLGNVTIQEFIIQD